MTESFDLASLRAQSFLQTSNQNLYKHRINERINLISMLAAAALCIQNLGLFRP